MRPHLLAIPALALIATACGKTSPASGTWVLGSQEVVSDTCGFGFDEDDDSGDTEEDSFDLVDNEDGTFTIDMGEDTELSCTLSGSSFTCPDTIENIPADGMDATLDYAIGIAGDFSGNEAMDATMTLTLSCEGADCTTLGDAMEMTVPCGAELSYSAEFSP